MPTIRKPPALESQYVETLADLSLVCLTWRPDGRRPELFEEVLEFLNAVLPFFDERRLFAVFKERAGFVPYSVGLFADHVERSLALERGGDHVLTEDQRLKVGRCLAAELLVRASLRTYETFRDSADGVQRALNLADRARQLHPDTPIFCSRWPACWSWGSTLTRPGPLSSRCSSPRARDPEVARGGRP